MEMITVTAKTVEDAITQASLQLGVSSDRIQYEVVEKGSAGVLGGLFGSKPAVIRAKKIETVDDKAVDFLNSVFDAMGLAVDVEVKMNEEEILQNMDYVSEQLVGAAEAIKADTDERRFDEAYDPMLRDVMMMARELLHLRDLLDELREGE